MRQLPVGIVLAAGRSRRFGGSKLTALVGGIPLIDLTLMSLRAFVSRLVVVVRPESGVASRLQGPGTRVVSAGAAPLMSDSIRAGVSAAGGADSVLIALGDQPVPPVVMERLIEGYRATSDAIVAPVYRGRRGNPVIFSSVLIPELLRLTGDHGARDLIDESTGAVHAVELDMEQPVDVDTAADVERLAESIRSAWPERSFRGNV